MGKMKKQKSSKYLRKFIEGFTPNGVILGLVLSTVSMIIDCLFLTAFADIIVAIGSGGDVLKASKMAILYYVVNILFSVAIDFWDWMYAFYANKRLEIFYFSRLYRKKPQTLKNHNSAYIANQISHLSNTKVSLMASLVENLTYAIIIIGYFTVRFWMLNWMIGMSLLVCTVLGSLIYILIRKPMRELSKENGKKHSEKDSIFIDALSNMPTIQKMNAMNFIIDKMKSIWSIIIHNGFTLTGLGNTAWWVGSLIQQLYIVVAVILYLKGVINGAVGLSVITYALSGRGDILYATRQFGRCLEAFLKYEGQQDSVDEVLDSEDRWDTYEKPFKNYLLEGISYVYEDKEKSQRPIKIDSFEIDRGDFICITGESGQGKSTLLNMISSDIQIDEGIINGKYSCKRLPSIYVSQDVSILDMSIRDNLTLGNSSIKDSTIIDMMVEIGLGDWFFELKDGLDSLLGERGVKVSTGQRQRLNLIRGMLLNAEIYLLDEPTANLDDQSELKVVNMIERCTRGKTVVCVTHKPEIRRLATKEYVYENGVCKLVK